jgi:hypothetical protein
MQHRFMCKHEWMTPYSLSPLFYIKLVLKVKQQIDAICCWVYHGRFHDVLPKNILGHSMMFHGDYIKRCLLTILVSQILYLTQLISEIKNIVTAANGLFSTLAFVLGKPLRPSLIFASKAGTYSSVAQGWFLALPQKILNQWPVLKTQDNHQLMIIITDACTINIINECK